MIYYQAVVVLVLTICAFIGMLWGHSDTVKRLKKEIEVRSEHMVNKDACIAEYRRLHNNWMSTMEEVPEARDVYSNKQHRDRYGYDDPNYTVKFTKTINMETGMFGKTKIPKAPLKQPVKSLAELDNSEYDKLMTDEYMRGEIPFVDWKDMKF